MLHSCLLVFRGKWLPWYRRWSLQALRTACGRSPPRTRSDHPGQPHTAGVEAPGTQTHTIHQMLEEQQRFFETEWKLWKINLTWLSDLGRAFGGAVESGAAEEKVDLLPGFTARLFHVEETLNLRTRSRLQQVLLTTSETASLARVLPKNYDTSSSALNM